MYTKIIEALKAKFEGVNEATLANIAKKVAETVTEESQVEEAVGKVTFQQVLESYGDARATGATKTAILNYEKKYGIKDGKPNAEPKPHEQTPPDDDVPAWAKTLIEANKALQDKVSAMAGEKLTADRKAQLGKVLEKLPQELRKGYERITLDNMEDEAFTTLLQEVGAEADGIQQAIQAKGAVFGRPVSGQQHGGQPQGNEATDAEVNDVLGRMGI